MVVLEEQRAHEHPQGCFVGESIPRRAMSA
jgi:hypothetical protein